jgi:hypothetical protein
MNTTAVVLPTGEQINPTTRVGYYADPCQTLLILSKPSRTRPTRVASTFGLGFPLGTVLRLQHDQTGGHLGDYTVVGVHHRDGRTEGEVPDRKLSQSVFK